MIKCKLLSKSPVSNSLSAEDELSVNLEYKSNLYKNKLPVLVSKVNKEQEKKSVEGKVEDDRRYTIEASIIKVMKSRRTIDYVNLVAEATKLLSTRFQPDPATVKQLHHIRLDHTQQRAAPGYLISLGLNGFHVD